MRLMFSLVYSVVKCGCSVGLKCIGLYLVMKLFMFLVLMCLF